MLSVMNKLNRAATALTILLVVVTGLSATGMEENSVSAEPVAAPNRIVQVGASAFMVENALYLFPEAHQQVVAVTNGNQGRGLFVADIDPGIDENALLPRNANTEEIIALQPDVVVMKNFMKQRMGEPLERVGIDTVYLDLETPEAWDRDLETLGVLFGNEERAAELRESFRKWTEEATRPLADLTEAEKPEVLFLYWSVRDGESSVNLPPLSYIQTRMVTMAGGKPVWRDAELGERWTRTGVEQVAAWDPDAIVVVAYHIDAGEAVEILAGDPTWSRLRAIREGRIHAFPADYHSWDQPDARWLLGLSWLAATLHPEGYPDLDMTAEARRFYRDMYGLDEASFDTLILPRLTGID